MCKRTEQSMQQSVNAAAASREEHVDVSMVRVMLEPLTEAQAATVALYTGPVWWAGGGLGGDAALAKVVAQAAHDGGAQGDVAMAVQIVPVVPICINNCFRFLIFIKTQK